MSLDNVPAFVLRLDAPIVTPRWGTIRADIAYGGVFYAKADVEEVGLRIVPERARELAEAVGETTVDPYPAVLTRITGSAWVFGRQELRMSPNGPFATGFALSDTGGPQVGEL